MANENSNVHDSLDSLKEEDEYDRLSVNSNMSEETKAKIRKAHSTSGSHQKNREQKEDSMNQDSDIKELQKDIQYFV
jgi:hypothetical protein